VLLLMVLVRDACESGADEFLCADAAGVERADKKDLVGKCRGPCI